MNAVNSGMTPQGRGRGKIDEALLNRASPAAKLRPSTGLWGRLLATLHHSHRRAAMRRMRRYRYLLEIWSHQPRTTRMTLSHAKSKRNTLSSVWLLILLACFAIIHGIAVVHIESTRRFDHASPSSATRVLPFTD
jgi:hypothetical protein